MIDNTRVNELQEKLLQAMDIVNAQFLRTISYDKTIVCTIENDENAEEGKYEVSDGTRIFEAYSNDTGLKSGTQVYVTIPEGNFENQKIIMGKKISKIEEPFIFKTPFDNFFSMTDNLAVDALLGELIANDKRKQSTELLNIQNIENLNIISYTRLAISADFKTWVKNAVKGNYGLAIIITAKKPDINETEKTNQYIYYLNSSDMYGNPYGFESWYSQEIVLDLAQQEIGQVIGIRVQFYQNADFYDEQNKLLPYKNENNEILLPNLFVQNLNVRFGYDASQFTKDYVEIYSADSINYNRIAEDNTKTINMRWVHILKQGPTDMVMQTDDREKVNYEVRWYRYRVGAPSADEYSSVYWEALNEGVSEDGFTCVFKPENVKQQEKIKAIVICDTIPYHSNELVFENEEELPLSQNAQYIANALSITTDDDTDGNYMIYGMDNSIKDSGQSEKIRTLSAWFDINTNGHIDKETESIAKYDNLTWFFPSENSMIELINHSPNYEKVRVEEYEKDKYFIKKEDESYEISKDETPDENQKYYQRSQQKGKFTQVNIYFPNRFYIYGFVQCSSESIFNHNISYYIQEEGIYKTIDITQEKFNSNKKKYWYREYILDDAEDFNETHSYYILNPVGYTVYNEKPQYKISSYYSPQNSNNTIICQYVLNGVTYRTEKEFVFGPAGTMGTDQTLIINFVGDRNGVIDKETNVEFQIKVYDKQNIAQTIPDGAVTWSWYYNSDISSAYYKIDGENNRNAVLELEYKKGFKINSLYILQATIGTLTTYFSIPVKHGDYQSYLQGPTQVIYSSDGKPSVTREEYKLYTQDNEEYKDITWHLKRDPDYKFIGKIKSKEEFEEIFESGYYYTINDKGYYKEVESAEYWDEFEDYYILEDNTEDNTYVGSITEQGEFTPLALFTKNAPVYGIQAIHNEHGILWTQPILVLQNRWSNNVTNAWEGKSLVLDSENSTIISASIAAGKKNSDNSFSGVMLGDWEGKDAEEAITKQTGVYGFNHGAMSYAFKEDGTAFIGPSGKGRIYFDGNASTLTSGLWSTEGEGMKIDLDEPSIILKTKVLDTDGNQVSENNSLKFHQIQLNGSNSSSNTYPFAIGDNFKVKWNGQMEAAGATFKGNISASVLTSRDTGYIDLYGKIRIIEETESEDGAISAVVGGYLGYVEANFGTLSSEDAKGETNEITNAGIGLSYGDNYGINSVVKATSLNAGMSYQDFYLSLQDKKAVLRSTEDDGPRLVLQSDYIEEDKTKRSKNDFPHAGLGYKKTYISCNTDRLLLASEKEIKMDAQDINILNGKLGFSLEKDDKGTITNGGFLSYATANFGGNYEDDDEDTKSPPAGIGMEYVGGGIVKATDLNAGMSYGNYYISLQENKAVFRTKAQGPRLVLDGHSADQHIGIGYNYTSISGHDQKILLEVGNTTEGKVSINDEVKINAEKLTFGPWTENTPEDKEWIEEIHGYKQNTILIADKDGIEINGNLTYKTGATCQLLWNDSKCTINFTNAKQYGIRAQFA